MLSVGAELQLEVLLLVVEEERLDHLVLPQLPVGLPGLAALGGRVAEVRGRDADDEILPRRHQAELHRIMVDRLAVPRTSDLKILFLCTLSLPGHLILLYGRAPDGRELGALVGGQQVLEVDGLELAQPVEVGLGPGGLVKSLIPSTIPSPVDGVGIEPGDVGRKVGGGYGGGALPCPSSMVYRSTVPQGQAVLYGVPFTIEDEHEMLSVGAELQLEVLLLVVEEERLDHLVLPQLPVGLPGLAALGGRVAEVRGRDGNLKIATNSPHADLGRDMVYGLPVPSKSDGVALPALHSLPPHLRQLCGGVREVHGLEVLQPVEVGGGVSSRRGWVEGLELALVALPVDRVGVHPRDVGREVGGGDDGGAGPLVLCPGSGVVEGQRVAQVLPTVQEQHQVVAPRA